MRGRRTSQEAGGVLSSLNDSGAKGADEADGVRMARRLCGVHLNSPIAGATMSRLMRALLLTVLASPVMAQGSPPQAAASQPYVMEYYYKTQWGRQQEFLQLFLKNHYPLLLKEK